MGGLPRGAAAARRARGDLLLRGAALALLGLGATGSAARAAAPSLEWLAPERVARQRAQVGLTALGEAGAELPRGAVVRAEGAALEELAPRGPVRVFALEPGAAAVILRAQQPGGPAREARVEVGPPAARVAIAARPASAVKGRDREIGLEIVVLGGGGTPDADAPPPVLRSNVGEILGLTPQGGGRFAARFALPGHRYPEVAIVVAFAPWPHADSPEGALGAAIVPLSASVSLPGTTEPDVSVSVEIAGRTFGPVSSDERGQFEIPVIVPPGYRYGTSRATDRAGNTRVKQVDLRLPPTDQLACVANPPSLPAGGGARARVLCVATDPYGAPASSAAIVASARAGRLSGPRPLGGGAFEWDYAAPDASVGRGDELSFEYPAGGPQSRERLALSLTDLALDEATLEVSPQPVFAGGAAVALLRARDARGRPAAVRMELEAARGALTPFEGPADGIYRATYRAPEDAGDWTDRIAGRVLAAPGSVAARLELSAAPGSLAARALALDGSPVEGLALAMGDARATTGPDGIARFALPRPSSLAPTRCEVRAAERPSLRAIGWLLPGTGAPSLFPDAGPFEAVRLEVSIALAPATPVDLRIEVVPSAPPAVRVRALDAQGRGLPGRALALALSREGGAPLAHGPPQPQPDGSVIFAVADGAGGAVIASAVDLESGVSASREARLP